MIFLAVAQWYATQKTIYPLNKLTDSKLIWVFFRLFWQRSFFLGEEKFFQGSHMRRNMWDYTWTVPMAKKKLSLTDSTEPLCLNLLCYLWSTPNFCPSHLQLLSALLLRLKKNKQVDIALSPASDQPRHSWQYMLSIYLRFPLPLCLIDWCTFPEYCSHHVLHIMFTCNISGAFSDGPEMRALRGKNAG